MKTVHQLHFQVQILVESDGEGFYAHTPIFPGVHAYGLTQKEALGHAVEGIACTVVSMVKHDEPLPCSFIRVDHAPRTRVVTRDITVPLAMATPTFA